LVLLIAFGVQTAQGTPTRTLAALRAVWCCLTVCHHSNVGAAASRCCGVAQSDGDVATVAPASRLAAPVADGALLVAPGVQQQVLPRTEFRLIGAVRDPPPRAAPLFLLTHSLRI